MCDVFYSLRHLAAKRFPSKCSFKKVIINLEMILRVKCLFSAVILKALLKFLFFPKRVLNLLPYQSGVLFLGQTVCIVKLSGHSARIEFSDTVHIL